MAEGDESTAVPKKEWHAEGESTHFFRGRVGARREAYSRGTVPIKALNFSFASSRTIMTKVFNVVSSSVAILRNQNLMTPRDDIVSSLWRNLVHVVSKFFPPICFTHNKESRAAKNRKVPL